MELKSDRESLDISKKKWQDEIKNIKNFLPDKLLTLDVGGLYFPKVSKKVLTSV